MDILEFKPGRRCYFLDLGLANYYFTRVGADPATIAGTINENYVYINLLKKQDFPEEIAFETPAFATYKGGELDFVVQGKANYLMYLKGNTKGGVSENIITLPIYMLEKYRF